MDPGKQQESELRRQAAYRNQQAFINYNIMRMREVIRYLSEERLNLFQSIPLLIHINDPSLPGYVKTPSPWRGIWDFQSSGYCKAALRQGKIDPALLQKKMSGPSDIMGLYHMGSLGTFTQSVGSDFDYWVIIDRHRFSRERLDFLKKKLDLIAAYCLHEFNQEVTFFTHDVEDIKNNRFDALSGGKSSFFAPRYLLKEEFYRTFIMVAGKLPFWAITPPGLTRKEYDEWFRDVTIASPKTRAGLVDLGNLETIPREEIIKAILWQICKSKEDPVKAMIKASMVACYRFGGRNDNTLLCDEIKKHYAESNLDDFTIDPYAILFKRILRFHETLKPSKTLNLVKNAIFLRLCGFPKVSRPASDTPKGRLLSSYIRAWHLDNTQLDKLLSYQKWPENEKKLLDKTLHNGLAFLYNMVLRDMAHNPDTLTMQNRSWTILKNKTSELLREKENKIPYCSTYLKRRIPEQLILKAPSLSKKKSRWTVCFHESDPEGSRQQILHSAPGFMAALGWITVNRLYKRSSAAMLLRSRRRLFQGSGTPCEPDAVYLSIQPWGAASDSAFASKPVWTRMALLLDFEKDGAGKLPQRADFLMVNSWGEFFMESLNLNSPQQNPVETITAKIHDLEGPGFKFSIFQLALAPNHDVASMIRTSLSLKGGEPFPVTGNTKRKRPFLDLI